MDFNNIISYLMGNANSRQATPEEQAMLDKLKNQNTYPASMIPIQSQDVSSPEAIRNNVNQRLYGGLNKNGF